jgi:ubiquitin conjugation factor E4 B
MVQELLSSDILDIINHMVRASAEARNRILDWFAAALNINHKRRAMQVDPATVSSDGFMFNLTTCLDHLCQPFMDANFTKVSLTHVTEFLILTVYRSTGSILSTYIETLVLT